MFRISDGLLEIIYEFINGIKYHIKINRVFLYGYHVNRNSSIDISMDLIIVSQDINSKNLSEITMFLMDKTLRYLFFRPVMINAIPINLEEFNLPNSAVRKRLQATGIEIDLR